MASGSREPAGPLIILDGMSLAFRAYFALPNSLATKRGVVTNAVHGFCSMLVNIVRDHRPSGLAVAFDVEGGTFRDELVGDYKGGRAETPDDLPHQFTLIHELMDVLHVPVIGSPGYEADDVMATLATEASAKGTDVILVTGDRDSFQLVSDPHVRVLYNRKGVSDYSLYDEAGIVERTGVPPDKYPLLAALRGDPSDNLPGVPGVGEKTAAKLLNTYGDLDGIFAHLAELTPKLRENLAANEDLVRSNLTVIPLVRDVPLDVTPGDLDLGGWDLEEAESAFGELEMRGVWRRIHELLDLGAFGPSGAGAAPGKGAKAADRGAGPDAAPLAVADPEVPADGPAAIAALERLGGTKEALVVAARWEGLAGRSPLSGVVCATGGDAPTAVWLGPEVLGDSAVLAALNVLFGKAPVAGHHVKEVLRSLLPLGVDCTNLVMDTAVAGFLIDPSRGDYSLEAVEAMVGSPRAATPDAADGQLALGAPDAVDPRAEAATEAARVAALVPALHEALLRDGMLALHDAVEVPLVRVLARMEVAGIRVDRDELRRLADELVADTKRHEAEIHRLAGHEFNVNSTPQLRTVLFDELGLTPGRKTKTGYSTDAQTLESLRDVHPIVEALLSYREVEKLRSTYGESLLAEVAEDGRIHASFRQTVARTGRLSSERPNLHNIPVRSAIGAQFRKVFVPAAGHRFLVADYDQIELRVIAHLSGDPGLVAAFSSGTDVHRAVAAGIYGVEPDEVTRTQRERAKTVSYGLAYGMEAFGLARRLGTSVPEANEIMDRYFGAFPSVRSYMDRAVSEARAQGFTRTERGRIRPLPELLDANRQVRLAAERSAMNAGIQGLAADLFKTALVRLDAALEDGGFESRLVLQVHDEVIVEAAAREADRVTAITREALIGAADLSVPLELSLSWGDSWADAKAG